jgi:hypothetical protein
MRAQGGERPGRRARPGLKPEPGSRSGMTPTGAGHLPAREEGEGEGDAGATGWGEEKGHAREAGPEWGKGPCARVGEKKREGRSGRAVANWAGGEEGEREEGDRGPGCRGEKRVEGGWPAGLGPNEKRGRGKKETNKSKTFEFKTEI